MPGAASPKQAADKLPINCSHASTLQLHAHNTHHSGEVLQVGQRLLQRFPVAGSLQLSGFLTIVLFAIAVAATVHKTIASVILDSCGKGRQEGKNRRAPRLAPHLPGTVHNQHVWQRQGRALPAAACSCGAAASHPSWHASSQLLAS